MDTDEKGSRQTQSWYRRQRQEGFGTVHVLGPKGDGTQDCVYVCKGGSYCPHYHGVTCQPLQTEKDKDTDEESSAKETHFTLFLLISYFLLFLSYDFINSLFHLCFLLLIFSLHCFLAPS